jgi:PPP family 3-phenylpropionic acid transporter
MINSDKRVSYTTLNYFNFFLFGSIAVLVSFLPLYFQGKVFTPVQIGLLMSVGPVISIFANPIWGFWSDRLQNDRLILLILLSGNLIFSQSIFGMEAFFLLLIVTLLFYFFQTAVYSIKGTS